MTRISPLPIAFALAFSLCAAEAHANSIVFDLNYSYTSGTLPTSALSWVTFTFRDTTDCNPGPCAANTVQLLIASSLESSGEFITQTNFNSTVAPLSIAYTSGSGSFGTPSVALSSVNGYDAGASIDFDMEASFPTSGSAGGSKRFNGFDTALFTITGSGITANTFNIPTPVDANQPQLWASAHIQGISATGPCGGTSAWVGDRNGTSSGGAGSESGTVCGTSVPDSGSTLALLGFAMMGVGYLRRRHL